MADEPKFDPKAKAFSLATEFKAFALRGNVIDLAVGVIIAAAFGKIIESLVKNILMPTISVLMPGDSSYQNWTLTVWGKPIPYGLFLGDVINFVVVAAALFFFVVKVLGFLMKAKASEPTKPTKSEELLLEIRDLLKAQSGQQQQQSR